MLFKSGNDRTADDGQTTAAYLKRGRIFRSFSDDSLQALWQESVALAQSTDGGKPALRQMADAACEMRLRGITVPEDPFPASGAAEAPDLSPGAPPSAKLRQQIADFHADYRRDE